MGDILDAVAATPQGYPAMPSLQPPSPSTLALSDAIAATHLTHIYQIIAILRFTCHELRSCSLIENPMRKLEVEVETTIEIERNKTDRVADRDKRKKEMIYEDDEQNPDANRMPTHQILSDSIAAPHAGVQRCNRCIPLHACMCTQHLFHTKPSCY